MRRTLTLCRTGLAGAAAVVLLTACGGGDSAESAADSSAETSAGGSATDSGAASGADEQFCAEAAAIEEKVNSALSGVGEDPNALVQALNETVTQVRAVDAPDEIAADWEALAGGLDEMAGVFTSIDVNDPEALAILEQQVGEIESGLTSAGTNVDNYLRDECGIEIDFTDPAAPSS